MAHDDLRPLAALRELFEQELEPIRAHLKKWKQEISEGGPPRTARRPAGSRFAEGSYEPARSPVWFARQAEREAARAARQAAKEAAAARKPPPPPIAAPPKPKEEKQPDPLGRGAAWLQLLMGRREPKIPGARQEAVSALAGPGMGVMLGNVAKAAGAFGMVAGVVTEVISTITRLRDEQVQYVKGLRTYNAAINNQAALLERQQLQFSYSMATATQGTSSELLASELKRNEAWRRFGEVATNASNRFFTGVNERSEQLGRALSDFADWAEDILIKLGYLNAPTPQGGQLPFVGFLNDAAAGKFSQPKNGGDL